MIKIRLINNPGNFIKQPTKYWLFYDTNTKKYWEASVKKKKVIYSWAMVWQDFKEDFPDFPYAVDDLANFSIQQIETTI